MTISERVAYLKGLAEGLGLDKEESKEGKLISVMMDILEDIGLSIADLEEETSDLGDALDCVSDDLAQVEELIYDEDEEEEDEDDEEEMDDDDFFEIECPNCKEKLMVDESVLSAGTIQCPSCEQKFQLDLGDDEE